MAIQAQSYQDQHTPSWFVSQDSQQRLMLMQNQISNPTQGIDSLQLQTEQLRVALQEQMKQHTSSLLKTLQFKTKLILNQKDQKLAAATQRTAQLQSLLHKLETEGHAWRRAAEENEAVVASLTNTLEELSKDRESRCDGVGDNEVGDLCKSCNAQGSCVLFLPCRHLCSCKQCEKLLGFCPFAEPLRKQLWRP